MDGEGWVWVVRGGESVDGVLLFVLLMAQRTSSVFDCAMRAFGAMVKAVAGEMA